MEEQRTEPAKRVITSHELSKWDVRACWAVAVILIGAGITATFIAGTGAAPAAMILFGSLFLVLALMGRVPLALEVGGAKINASYEVLEAFDEGLDLGRQRGVEVALSDVEKAEEAGESPQVALERRRDAWATDAWSSRVSRMLNEVVHADGGEVIGYPGPTACQAAGITLRQLDYWDRSGFVSPSARLGDRRLYTERDIVLLKMAKRLLDTGISLQHIRSALLHLRDRPPADLTRVTLMSDGQSVFEATSQNEVLGLLRGGTGVFGIALGGVIREVKEALDELAGEVTGPDDEPPDHVGIAGG